MNAHNILVTGTAGGGACIQWTTGVFGRCIIIAATNKKDDKACQYIYDQDCFSPEHKNTQFMIERDAFVNLLIQI
jgi:hypothetical protein